MNFLGIDFGLKRIGLAFSDSSLATPLIVLVNHQSVVFKISRLCRKHQIEKIVIGLPEGMLKKKVKKFGQKLALASSLPVVYQDETLTSQEAIAKMIEAGKGKEKRRKFQDAAAAAIILQSYLDTKRQ